MIPGSCEHDSNPLTCHHCLTEALAASQREREQLQYRLDTAVLLIECERTAKEDLQARVEAAEKAIRFALSQNPVCSAGWIKVLNDALSPPAAPVQAEGDPL